MNQKLLMSSEEFERIKPKLHKLSVKTNELARLILVEGKSKTEAARLVGMSHQNVSNTMKRVQALISGYPSNWVLLEEWMPDHIAVEVRAMIKREKAKLDIQ